MAKHNKVTKRKLSSLAERVSMPVEKFLEIFLAKKSKHTDFTRAMDEDEAKESRRRKMRKAVWAKQRGYR